MIVPAYAAFPLRVAKYENETDKVREHDRYPPLGSGRCSIPVL